MLQYMPILCDLPACSSAETVGGANEEEGLISFTEQKLKRYTELFWELEPFDCARIGGTITCRFY